MREGERGDRETERLLFNLTLKQMNILLPEVLFHLFLSEGN